MTVQANGSEHEPDRQVGANRGLHAEHRAHEDLRHNRDAITDDHVNDSLASDTARLWFIGRRPKVDRGTRARLAEPSSSREADGLRARSQDELRSGKRPLSALR